MSYHPTDLRSLPVPPGSQLTPLAPTSERDGGSVVWRCRCVCNRIILVRADVWAKGRKRHCGCQQGKRTAPRSKGAREILADERRVQVRELRAQRMTLKEIGRRVGISGERVRQMLKEDNGTAGG